MTHAVTTAIGDYGLYAVFLLMAVDAVFPAASELVMVYAGALAAGAFPAQDVTLFGAQIDSAFWAYVAMAGAGTLGYLVGSLIGWGIGRYGGRLFLERRGRWVHVTPENLDRAEAWFQRYGDAAVLLGRVVPVVRSFISIPAGVLEMPLGRYTVLTAIGSAAWCFALAGVGFAVGSSWEHFQEQWRYADYAVGLVVAAAVVYGVVRFMRRRARRRAVQSPTEG
ncbi:MAG TPA: DedA family protein [Gaiellaceae bacterium]|jgi:membrane protein DedA with SNARE-associated domain